MTLVGDTVVYILVLLAVLAVVAGIMFAVARVFKPPPEEIHTRATRAYQNMSGQGTGTQRTA
jgi:hypothetical protein